MKLWKEGLAGAELVVGIAMSGWCRRAFELLWPALVHSVV
jgi:hypothetical protein